MEVGGRAVRRPPPARPKTPPGGGAPMVACPQAQLTDILTRLVDFALRRLRDAPAPRELRVAISEAGPPAAIALWGSGAPPAVGDEPRLVWPGPFSHTPGRRGVGVPPARAAGPPPRAA